ncbi:MAG: cytochrome c oxidase subunit 3 [Acidobacteria bacterium]|nr:cytochrome c oxidase subunit 3 [Acidobacteriota bacterium]
MASVLTPTKPPAPAGSGGPPGGFRAVDFGGGDRGGGGGPDETALSIRRYKTGMWLALGAVVMVFAAFTSAYVVRKGMSLDWQAIRLPSILWLNTAVLLASSATIEKARRERQSCESWLAATSVLGAAFLAGQYVAWQQLRAAGVFLASNPSSSFFYLLTGAHGVHLLGGVLALFYVAGRAWRGAEWPNRQAAVEATALYWHFMDGLWIYLFFLLQVGGK